MARNPYSISMCSPENQRRSAFRQDEGMRPESPPAGLKRQVRTRARPQRPAQSRDRAKFSDEIRATRQQEMNQRVTERRLQTESARLLGWLGMAIGVAQIAAPDSVAKLLGLTPSPRLRGILRVLGVREIMQGFSLAGEDDRDQLRAGVGARVAGDVLDGILLARAATKTEEPLRFTLAAMAATAMAGCDVGSAASV